MAVRAVRECQRIDRRIPNDVVDHRRPAAAAKQALGWPGAIEMVEQPDAPPQFTIVLFAISASHWFCTEMPPWLQLITRLLNTTGTPDRATRYRDRHCH